MSYYSFYRPTEGRRLSRPSWQYVLACGALLNLSRNFAGPRVAFLAAYQLRYTLDILCFLDSPLPSTADLSRNGVRLVNFAQKIFNRTDRPILVRKLFTNVFSALSLLLANEFDRRFILGR